MKRLSIPREEKVVIGVDFNENAGEDRLWVIIKNCQMTGLKKKTVIRETGTEVVSVSSG